MKYQGKGALPFWIDVNEDERNEIKAASAKHGLSMKQWLRQAVQCQLAQDGIFFEDRVSDDSQSDANENK